MKTNDVAGRRTVKSSFYPKADLRTPSAIGDILDIVVKWQSEFAITGYTTSQASQPRYKPIERGAILSLWQPDVLSYPILTCGGNKYKFKVKVYCPVQPDPPECQTSKAPIVWIEIHESYFEVDTSERTRLFLDFMKSMWSVLTPSYGYSHNSFDKLAIATALSPSGIFSWLNVFTSFQFGHVHASKECPIEGVFWANWLGPECRATYFSNGVTNVPGVVRAEEIEHGGVLILTDDNPLASGQGNSRKNQLVLWRHLGLSPIPKLTAIDKYYRVCGEGKEKFK